jgi:hypothetical protein
MRERERERNGTNNKVIVMDVALSQPKEHPIKKHKLKKPRKHTHHML